MGFSALFDLRRHQPCFDFFTWLAQVKTMGATEVVLQTKEIGERLHVWGESSIRQRVETILRPGPAFAGLPCRDGDEGEDVGTSKFKQFIETYQPGFKFERLVSVLPPKKYRYTVTLRKSTQKTWRNSDESVWRAFAADIGALLIEDHSVKPIGLHKRVAIYAGAEMNFFVPNGPGHLLYMTEYPYAVFGCGESENGFVRIGVPAQGQIPWASQNQRLVWETPTRSSLHRFMDQLS